MRGRAGDERGAALVMVLVFMVITLILITATLAVTGNEIQIAALHRDGVRALELANAGIQEAVARILAQHPVIPLGPMTNMDDCPAATGGGKPLGFTSSVDPTNLQVGVCGVATGAQFLVVYADAKVGNAVRKLAKIVQIRERNVPPEIVLAGFVGGGGSQNTNGDTYAPQSIVYKNTPVGDTFSGWRIGQDNNPDQAEKSPNDASVWCYGRNPNPAGTPGTENSQCNQDTPADDRWFPGTRLAISESDSGSNTAPCSPGISTGCIDAIKNNNAETFPACTSTVDLITTGVRADDVRAFSAQQSAPSAPFNRYGFDQDPDLVGGVLFYQAMTNKHPCGLPYAYIEKSFQIQDGSNTITVTRYFKTVIFEQWFETYYEFCFNRPTDTRCTGKPQSVVDRNAAACGSTVCLAGLNTVTNVEPDRATNPQFAAIPPFPSTDFLTNICNNSNPYVAASGVPTLCGKANPLVLKSPVTTGEYDLGNPAGINANNCPTTGGTPRVGYFKPAAGDEVKFSSGMSGYGVLFIDGNAEFAGGFSYTGTIFSTGDVEFGGGNVTIDGGLVVKGKVTVTGNLTLNASDCVGTTAFTDAPIVALGAFWER